MNISCSRPAGQSAAGHGPLQVVTSASPVHIQQFSCQKQAPALLRLHGIVHFGQRYAAAGDLGVVKTSRAGHIQIKSPELVHERTQFPV